MEDGEWGAVNQLTVTQWKVGLPCPYYGPLQRQNCWFTDDSFSRIGVWGLSTTKIYIPDHNNCLHYTCQRICPHWLEAQLNLGKPQICLCSVDQTLVRVTWLDRKLHWRKPLKTWTLNEEKVFHVIEILCTKDATEVMLNKRWGS